MRKLIAFVFFVFIQQIIYAQTPTKTYEGGHIFQLNLPTYMSKTGGLNSAASIQYKSVIKDIYGFVIYDTKEELSLVEMNFSSISEFYEEFIKDFLVGEKNRKISKPKISRQGKTSFIESDVTYYDQDAEIEIFYLVGVVETEKAFYKVISWSAADKKDQFKADFQQILYSLRD
jgi:hypothetical protein